MPPTERTLTRVLEKARRIWQEEARPFSYLDFREYKPSYFRKIASLLRNRGLIYRWHGKRSKPQFWVPASEGNRYPNGGGSETLLAVLDSLDWDSLYLHDIRLRAYSPEMCKIVFAKYPLLKRYHGFSSRRDGSIVCPAIRWGKLRKRKTRAVFYRTGTILVEVSCSNDPIPVDELNLRYLAENLIDVRRLILNALYRVLESASPPLEECLEMPGSWTVVQVHVNRDASPKGGLRIDRIPAVTLEKLSRTLRLYYHRGLSKIRAEAVESPEVSLRVFFKRLGLYGLENTGTPYYIA